VLVLHYPIYKEQIKGPDFISSVLICIWNLLDLTVYLQGQDWVPLVYRVALTVKGPF